MKDQSNEALAKLGKSVTPTKVGVQKCAKILDSVFQRNDEEALLQEAPMGTVSVSHGMFSK